MSPRLVSMFARGAGLDGGLPLGCLCCSAGGVTAACRLGVSAAQHVNDCRDGLKRKFPNHGASVAMFNWHVQQVRRQAAEGCSCADHPAPPPPPPISTTPSSSADHPPSPLAPATSSSAECPPPPPPSAKVKRGRPKGSTAAATHAAADAKRRKLVAARNTAVERVSRGDAPATKASRAERSRRALLVCVRGRVAHSAVTSVALTGLPRCRTGDGPRAGHPQARHRQEGCAARGGGATSAGPSAAVWPRRASGARSAEGGGRVRSARACQTGAGSPLRGGRGHTGGAGGRPPTAPGPRRAR